MTKLVLSESARRVLRDLSRMGGTATPYELRMDYRTRCFLCKYGWIEWFEVQGVCKLTETGADLVSALANMV